MIYNFAVPVQCEEHFSVIAESYEEALDKISNNNYHVEPSLENIEWDFGFRDSEEELSSCYTLEEWTNEQDKIQALEHEVEFLKGKVKKLSE